MRDSMSATSVFCVNASVTVRCVIASTASFDMVRVVGYRGCTPVMGRDVVEQQMPRYAHVWLKVYPSDVWWWCTTGLELCLYVHVC